MKLKDIMNTDCYVEFDSNEQLRDFCSKLGIPNVGFYNSSNDCDKWLSFYYDGSIFFSDDNYRPHVPVHHHSTIEL